MQELVLSCIKSSDAERRRIFYRMVHTTPRNKEKTRNRRKNTVSANAKNGAPRAPHKHHHTPYQTPLAVKEQTRRYCLRYTRRFDRLALRPIEASAPQNWGSLSTTSLLQIPKSWGESVSISRSYDRNDFQGRYTTPKKSHFCLDSFSLVSTIFSILSSLSGSTRPHLALETQNFRNSDEKNVKNLHSKCEKCNFGHNFRPRKKKLFF